MLRRAYARRIGARYRWVILAAGTLAQASFACSSVALAALGPALRSSYGLTLSEVGVVLAALPIGMLFTYLPWGLLADRRDERFVILLGLSGAAVFLALAGETHRYLTVTLALVVAGALGASVNAASGRAVMSWFGPSELGLALGIRQTAIPIGGAIGAATLPALASAGGTRLAFFCLGGACAVGGIAAGIFMRGTPPAEQEALDTRPLHDPRLWLLSGGSALYLTAQIGITSFVVLFLHQHRHVPAHRAAWLLAGINVLAIAARIASGRISDALHSRLRPLRAIGIALAVATAAVAALLDAPLAVLAPLFVVAGVLSMAWNGVAFAAAAEAAGAARTGAALGFQQTMLGVLTAGAPPLLAAIASSSWRAAYVVAAAGPVAGWLLLRLVAEASPRAARRPGTSAIPPAAP